MELRALCKQLNSIYARKNNEEGVLTDINGAMLFISGSLKALNDDVARSSFRNKDKLLAILMKRTLLAIELWGTDSFIADLSRKYPKLGCAYCRHKPCACGKIKKAPATLHTPDISMSTWSLRDWQVHLDHVYGDTNRFRYSVQDMVVQLNAEYLEVMIALQHHLVIQRSSEVSGVAKMIAREETTDLFSRILGLGNHVGVDIESVLLTHYEHGCPKCKNHTCSCPGFWEEYKTYERAIVTKRTL